MNAIAAPRIVSDPTFNHLRRTRRPLRRNASSPERPSNSIAGAMSAQRTVSQTAIGIKTTKPARSKTARTEIISATKRDLRLPNASR